MNSTRPVRGARHLSWAAGIAIVCASLPALALTPSQTARVLAGLPLDDESAALLAERDAMDEHERLDAAWREFEEGTGAAMSTWAASEVPSVTDVVFYPFGGADLTTAHRLFPNAERYVLVALHPGGPLPELETSPAERTLRFFADIAENFARRGFYLTDDMNDQFEADGELVQGLAPWLAAIAEREGFEVLDVRPASIASDGSIVPGTAGPGADWSSVRLDLRRRSDGASVIVDYVQLDLSDEHLDTDAAGLRFVQTHAQHSLLLKAASHLPQYRGFERFREAVVGVSPLIVQDETGIDHDLLTPEYDITLYGDFTRANTLWGSHQHSSLIAAYASRDDVRELPFSIGYRKESGPCMLVARRRIAATP